MKQGDKFQRSICGENEVDTMLQIHDIAMSDDIHIACIGRIVKAVSMPMAVAIHAEIDRIDDEDVYVGLLYPMASAIATCVYVAFDNMLPMPDLPPHVRRKALKGFKEHLDESLELIFKQDKRNGN